MVQSHCFSLCVCVCFQRTFPTLVVSFTLFLTLLLYHIVYVTTGSGFSVSICINVDRVNISVAIDQPFKQSES